MKRLRQLLKALLLTVICMDAQGQTGLTVNVHCDEPGTLYQKIMAQIEELGELEDITSLTISGRLNRDDQMVLRDQMKNILTLDLGGIDADCAQFAQAGGRKRLRSVVLPQEATNELPGSMLSGCDSLTAITMPPGLTAIPPSFAQGCRLLTAISIPQSVTTIGNRAFWGCYVLNNVVIPAGVTEIQSQTFADCLALNNITFLCSSCTLRGTAFSNTGFKTFTLPQAFTINGDNAFSNCKQLTSFTFPDGLIDETQVGTSTFNGCTALTSVRLPADLTVIPYGFFSGTAITHYTLPATIRRIDQHAFWGAQVEEFDWPAAVTIIPNEVFRSCEKLTRVSIPATVDSIGGNAFLSCYSLNHVRLPEGIRTLAATFNQCTSLDDVNIPRSVTYIGSDTFNGCKFTTVDIPDGVTYIGFQAFKNVPLEGEVRLPSKLKRIGGWAFIGGQYERIVVPEGCVSIGDLVFGSNNLKFLDLPSTLISMGGGLLSGYSNCQPDSIILRAMVPPYSSSDIFGYNDKDNTLYVPQASLSLYQADSHFNMIQTLAGIDISSPTLTITGETVIDQNSGLQQGKYDVKYFTTWGHSDILEKTSDHHPRLIVQEGTTFHARRISYEYEPTNQWWFTQHKFDTFINHGTVTADVVDMRYLLNGTYYFTPSFDVRMSDISPERPNTPFAFYRYNGGARAAGNFNVTWVRVGSDETLRAGQGYAVRSDLTPYTDANGKWTRNWTALHLTPQQGGSNYFLASGDITLPLQHYSGEFAHNRNWNFIGQPYPAYLDIRGIDYDGPILVNSDANGSGSTWHAYSALDDQLVIDPMAAIFLQAPDGMNSVTFLSDRRQTGKTFIPGTATNSTRALRRADQNRQRIRYDATLLRQTEQGDSLIAHTRFVINPATTTGYDIGHDAPLMTDAPATQLYTQAGGVAYAINERPLADGIVHLGLQLADAGTYTLVLTVKGSQAVGDFPADAPVWLIDHETGTRTQLTEASYTFTAPAGSHPQRFTIALGDAQPTAISTADVAQPISSTAFFDLGGRRVSHPQRGLYLHNGKIVFQK